MRAGAERGGAGGACACQAAAAAHALPGGVVQPAAADAAAAPAGTEPRQLFNVVQFVIHDVGCTGRVTLEEAMKLTYLRFGRVRECSPAPIAARPPRLREPSTLPGQASGLRRPAPYYICAFRSGGVPRRSEKTEEGKCRSAGNWPPPLPQEELTTQLEAVFGTADINSGKTLTLTEFMQSLQASQIQQLRSRPTMKQAVKGAGPPGAPAVTAKAGGK